MSTARGIKRSEFTIPKSWTFKDAEVAKHFDDHVREQLPWYDLATQAVEHIARHYVPMKGIVYDVGASTGNIGRALEPLLLERQATLYAIEQSKQMHDAYHGPGTVLLADATEFDFKDFDFCVCFLTMMFVPVAKRRDLLNKLVEGIRPGGALVIVDKVNTPAGYWGTVMRRLAMRWKRENGATADQILSKELSLAGYQRPLDPDWLTALGAGQWFRLGEFAGWLIEGEGA